MAKEEYRREDDGRHALESVRSRSMTRLTLTDERRKVLWIYVDANGLKCETDVQNGSLTVAVIGSIRPLRPIIATSPFLAWGMNPHI